MHSTRNNFYKYKLEILDNTTDTKFLNDFSKADQGVNRCAPKLTDAHIYPGPFQKMKVQFALQVFSATVAAGMRTCIKCNTLPIAAETTVNFIYNMDKIFDILNSKPKAGGKEFNLPFKNKTKTVNGITTNVDVTQRMKFINGWKITIKSLLQLWDDIQKPQYFLCTYRLNQDCLENLFGNFRNQNGNNFNPIELDLTSKNGLTYVSGYLIKKCLEKHSCDTCLDFAKTQESLDKAFIFIYLKAYQNEVASNY
ncbi:THAP-type domain-containing protein [Aphis craccivora]|uniref:THAP-type domain-containing protein n=1 Tax=Aphis craccivora TaxID=307492 RepID=A0A6G0YJL8_APHCR|nr:THAP-type domain-containing protein [Aphis craccivora]